jgi:hypothetical protein
MWKMSFAEYKDHFPLPIVIVSRARDPTFPLSLTVIDFFSATRAFKSSAVMQMSWIQSLSGFGMGVMGAGRRSACRFSMGSEDAEIEAKRERATTKMEYIFQE